MILRSMSGRSKKVFFLVFKTEIHKFSINTFQVDFTLINYSLKRFFEIA